MLLIRSLVKFSVVVAVAAVAVAGGCGPGDVVVEGDDADPEGLFDNEFVGDDFDDADDPDVRADVYDDFDDVPDPDNVLIVEGVREPDEPEGSGGGGDVDLMMSGGPAVGSKMVTTKYAGFHVHADADSALLDVAPDGGVADDSLHPYRNPAGVIPPGHTVILKDTTVHSGFYKVKYDDVVGYVAKSKLVWRDPSLTARAFALQPSARSAFFKHQVHRSALNRDGPMHSGNCAPTSVAMAALVFGKETSHLSVEESIHRIRKKYDSGLHESDGTSRSEVKTAAQAVGLNTHVMSTDVSPSTGLSRLKDQLAAGRVVVLFGQPGKPNSGATVYEQAFTHAYQQAIDNGASLMHSSYNFNGHHAIVVLGRDGDGKFITGDPLSEVGFVALTSDQIKDFMTRFSGNRGTGVAVW